MKELTTMKKKRAEAVKNQETASLEAENGRGGKDYVWVKVNKEDGEEIHTALVKKVGNRYITMKRNTVLLENNIMMLSVVSVFFVPYILGMLTTLVLYYFYVGVSVSDFFHVYSGLSQLIFWVLGFYLIITFTDVWLIMKKILQR